MTTVYINGIPLPTQPEPGVTVRFYQDDAGVRHQVRVRRLNETAWDVGIRTPRKRRRQMRWVGITGWVLPAKGETEEEMCEKGWRRFCESRSKGARDAKSVDR